MNWDIVQKIRNRDNYKAGSHLNLVGERVWNFLSLEEREEFNTYFNYNIERGLKEMNKNRNQYIRDKHDFIIKLETIYRVFDFIT